MTKISMPAIREINGESEMPTKEVNARIIGQSPRRTASLLITEAIRLSKGRCCLYRRPAAADPSAGKARLNPAQDQIASPNLILTSSGTVGWFHTSRVSDKTED